MGRVTSSAQTASAGNKTIDRNMGAPTIADATIATAQMRLLRCSTFDSTKSPMRLHGIQSMHATKGDCSSAYRRRVAGNGAAIPKSWVEVLGRNHAYLRYDTRGCGLSDRSPEELSFEAWVHDLEAVVDAAQMERFPLLGVSQGGAIATAYAVRHPERVSHLVLYRAFSRSRVLPLVLAGRALGASSPPSGPRQGLLLAECRPGSNRPEADTRGAHDRSCYRG